jgi:hypothetical protein
MTSEQQEMFYVATIAKESGFRRVEIDPDDVIALLRRMEALERTLAFADRERDQDVARIESLMREVDETEAKWVEATGCSTPDAARERMRELDDQLQVYEQNAIERSERS